MSRAQIKIRMNPINSIVGQWSVLTSHLDLNNPQWITSHHRHRPAKVRVFTRVLSDHFISILVRNLDRVTLLNMINNTEFLSSINVITLSGYKELCRTSNIIFFMKLSSNLYGVGGSPELIKTRLMFCLNDPCWYLNLYQVSVTGGGGVPPP